MPWISLRVRLNTYNFWVKHVCKNNHKSYFNWPILYWRPAKGLLANSADSDESLLFVASDLSLHCLQIV